MTMVHRLLTYPTIATSPLTTTSIRSFRTNQLIHPIPITFSTHSSFKLLCIRNDTNHKPSQDFSILKSKTDIQFDNGSTWSTLAFYIFSLHIPLSFGGLSVVAQLLHQTVLDPNTQAVSLLLIQTLELAAFISLLKFSESRFNILGLFDTRVLPERRNWLLASVLGVGFLLALVFLTSLVADKLIGPKDVNNPIMKDILSSGPLSVMGFTLVYCLVTPLLEETVYRGFLLTSLTAKMKWEKAVVVSSVVFSATHLSVDSFVQLFVVGVVLGCSYCWTDLFINDSGFDLTNQNAEMGRVQVDVFNHFS